MGVDQRVAAAFLLCALATDARADDPAIRKRLLDEAQVQRIGFRLAYNAHALYRLPPLDDPAAALRLPDQDLIDPWGMPYRAQALGDGNHWRVSGAGADKTFGSDDDIVLDDGTETRAPYRSLHPAMSEGEIVNVSRLAHDRMERQLDAPLEAIVDSIPVAIGVIEYYAQMTKILNFDGARDAFRADETKFTMRRLAARIEQYTATHGGTAAVKSITVPMLLGEPSRLNRFLDARDEWRGELRIDVAGGHYTIVSAGADRHFEPGSWSKPLTVADPREDLVMTDGAFTRASYLSAYMEHYLAEASAPKPEEPPFRVGGDVTLPAAIERPDPQYTPEARAAGVEGLLIIECIIDAKGNVTAPRVLKGLHPSLDDSVVATIRKWRFRPATKNGKPVPVYYNLTVMMNLK